MKTYGFLPPCESWITRTSTLATIDAVANHQVAGFAFELELDAPAQARASADSRSRSLFREDVLKQRRLFRHRRV